ncbi:hypothetical protein OAN307_c29700 [Octadecabacter antarcticus 307]|uniref:Uncharacterized protein n=1 Tax=Octadecabacter antarcticus 307 TaxID=391626 RepID=M9RFE0_9RHOB|nr:hypothetical protein [Octadecabacter antarcticus]AGI68520.1 hypothetical protein OAN307_c29700 [Octadecabacter antarcticus 307]
MTLEDAHIWISELDPILTILILNFLLGIWLLLRIKRAQQQITWLKVRLTDLRFVSERPAQPSVSNPSSKVPELTSLIEKNPLIPNEATPTSEDLNIKAFQVALQDGSSIEDTAKLFRLTDDEKKVAAISYRKN